jgi:hypothetical protein
MRCAAAFGTQPLGIVSFLLTPQETRRRIPATFPLRFRSRGPGRERVRVVPRARALRAVASLLRQSASAGEWRVGDLEPAGIEGGETCSICRVGLCNVLIRNAWPAATGCVQATPEENFAATVTRRFTMYRRRWALACGCVPARSAVTVPRVVHPGGRGKRRSRANGPRSPRRRRGEPSPQEFLSALQCSESYLFFPAVMIGVNPSAEAASG